MFFRTKSYIIAKTLAKLKYLTAILFINIIFFNGIVQGETLASDPVFQSNRSQAEKFEQEKEIANMNKDIDDKILSEKEKDSNKIDDDKAFKSKSQQEFFITAIKVRGIKSLWQFQINHLIKPYQNTYLNLDKILELRHKIQQLYIKNGYVTTQVYIKQQNLLNGILEIHVLEGKISNIKLLQDNKEYKYHPRLFFAMPSVYLSKLFKRQALNLRELDIAIENINHLDSNNARMKLQADNKPGYSNIIILNKPKRKAWFNKKSDKFQFGDRTKLSLGIENTGLDQTGRWRKVITFSQDDLLGSNDNLTLFNSSNLHKYNGSNSSMTSLNYQIPFGKLKFTFSYIKSDYLSNVNGLNRNFNLTGDTLINSQKIEYQVFLSKFNKTIIFAKLNSWNIKNFLEDAQIDVSSRRSTTIELGLSSLTRFSKGKGYYYFTFSHIKGLDTNRAKLDTNIYNAPHNQFEKYRINAILGRNFSLFSYSFTLEQKVSAQYSKNTLYPQEQFFMGDRTSVRGFQDHYLMSDSGGFMQSEVIYNFKNYKIMRFLSPFINNFKIFAAYDFGYVKPRYNENLIAGQNYGKLSGVTIGARWNARYSSFEIAFSKPLSYPVTMQNVSSYFIYFSCRINFI